MEKEERTRIELNPGQTNESKDETPAKQETETDLTVRELEERIAPLVPAV